MTSERAAHVVCLFLIAMPCGASPAAAQAPLPLTEAIRRAQAHNPDAEAAVSSEREAAERVVQARAGYLPRVDVEESWLRGNGPAFVFGALLAERRLMPDAFGTDALNYPVAADTFRASLAIDQPLFDRVTPAHVRAASIARDIAAADRRRVRQDLAAAVTDAFGRVLTAMAAVRSAAAAVDAARADRELAASRRDAGRATDADVMQLDVYQARTHERRIQAIADERIARAQLNQLMGEPLGAMFSLDVTPPAMALDITEPARLEDDAVRNRPEVAMARQQVDMAGALVDASRAAFLPHVAARAVFDLNGATWNARSSSWTIGAVARLNLFHGLADRARLAEARQLAARRAIEQRRSETMVRLDVQIAIARVEAARASDAAAHAAAEWARTSYRIVRDRYETGLADVAALLRASDAVQDAETQQTAASVSVLTAGAHLQQARGKS